MFFKPILKGAHRIIQAVDRRRDKLPTRAGLRVKFYRELLDILLTDGAIDRVAAAGKELLPCAPPDLEETRRAQYWALLEQRFREGNTRAATARVVMRRRDNGRPYWYDRQTDSEVSEEIALGMGAEGSN